MSATTAQVRRLLERTGEHPVISLFFDLDPDRFATAPARATQARSLLDAVRNLAEADGTLGHDAQATARADIARLDDLLGSDELPVSGADGLAVYACGAVDLLETIELSGPVAAEVRLARAPHIEPVVTRAPASRWCAVIVSSSSAEIYRGTGRVLHGRQHLADYVRGHSQVGGTARHSEDQDIEGHIIQVAGSLHADWRADGFGVLLLGGPVDALTRLQDHLHGDLRPALAGEPLAVDPSALTDATLLAAVGDRLNADAERRRGALLAEFAEHRQAAEAAGREAPPRAVAGVEHVLRALTEQRVQTLLLARDFHAAGGRCPRCGMLVGAETPGCPVDGTATAPVEDLREPMVVAAIGQDAEVVALVDPVDELPPAREVGAILRF